MRPGTHAGSVLSAPGDDPSWPSWPPTGSMATWLPLPSSSCQLARSAAADGPTVVIVMVSTKNATLGSVPCCGTLSSTRSNAAAEYVTVPCGYVSPAM